MQLSEKNPSVKRDLMNLLAWIVVGLIAGWLAGMVMKRGGYGLLGDIVVGILGALIGGFAAAAVFGIPDAVNGINPTSIVVAFIGALVLVAILRALSGRAHI